MNAGAVFHFAFAKVMQERLPARIMFEIFRDMPGDKNVPSIAAIHYPLCHVDSSTGHI